MTFNVRLFAYQRDRFGESIEVQSEPNVKALMASLGARGLDVSSSRIAVNDAFVHGDRQLAAADDISLIPPVSGG